MRDLLLDNVKFVLILLVVVGHVIEPLMGQFDWVKSLYVFVYLFHMPMFAYVSGVVSSRSLDDKTVRGIVSKLIIPYILLELIYSIFDYYLFSRNGLSVTPLVPYWILWYLFSLILWRVLLPIFAQFKFPILLSIAAGLACGFNNYGYNLSFSRTFVFFPFFLIGHYHHRLIIEKVRGFKFSKLSGWSVLALTLVVLLMVIDVKNLKVGWLYGSWSYNQLGVDWLQGILNRLFIYIAACVLGVALLMVVNSRRGAGTAYGENSLPIYVLHGFVMKMLIAIGAYSYIKSDWHVVGLILLSLVLLPVLSSRLATITAENMMNPVAWKTQSSLSKILLVQK